MGTVAASISPMDIWSALMTECYSRVETAGQACVTTAARTLAASRVSGAFRGEWERNDGEKHEAGNAFGKSAHPRR
ncbi:hypothetical protein GCM10010384_42950 [Streptomyces djakartensis]|uniref:Uncharacterized protein n=1 Tax=Streptomyces djakartensis TaxID=68193 RepID=A0ABQ3A032_9ACTN|nr:hypothetical protein GCM10010384_42950 [Streptomyces djakartensis]